MPFFNSIFIYYGDIILSSAWNTFHEKSTLGEICNLAASIFKKLNPKSNEQLIQMLFAVTDGYNPNRQAICPFCNIKFRKCHRNAFRQLSEEVEFVKGYFTLSNYGISRDLIPENLQKKFPRSYLTIPTTLLGRLARDKNCKQSRVGEFLLMDALYKAYQISLDLLRD